MAIAKFNVGWQAVETAPGGVRGEETCYRIYWAKKKPALVAGDSTRPARGMYEVNIEGFCPPQSLAVRFVARDSTVYAHPSAKQEAAMKFRPQLVSMIRGRTSHVNRSRGSG